MHIQRDDHTWSLSDVPQSADTWVQYMGSTPSVVDATIADLMDRLANHTLDPRYESLGNFLYLVDPNTWDPRQSQELGRRFVGFHHVFCDFKEYTRSISVFTRDLTLIESIRSAIVQNKLTQRYADAQADHLEFLAYWERQRVDTFANCSLQSQADCNNRHE